MITRILLLFLISVFSASVFAQQIPEPADMIGFKPGTDYKLADKDQLEAYYRAVADASDRIILREIGTTHHGNTLLLLIISSEENLAQLDHYRSISERLARARGLTDEEARQLSEEGKPVVWIDSGLHSPELAHSQHNPAFVYHMATDESEETRRMRDDVILLNMPLMNPDGHQIVVDWYRKYRDTAYELTEPPYVYHEYIGHDNNRDWYMLLQNESRAVAKVIYNEWYPQIVVNHHQMGEMPPRMFIPPFDDPVNPNIPPMAVRGTNLVGEHMANRFAAEGKSGIIQGITFNMWWNGGMRTAPYFHNMVGILTESTHRSPVPKYWAEDDIPETLVRGSVEVPMKSPSIFYPDPWQGGWTSLGQMVDYHLTASLGVMDIASKRKEEWLYNMYQMGRNAIELGNNGSPYAYIIPPDQWDAPETIEMLKCLDRGGIEIHRATSNFTVGDNDYPEGSYVIYAAQAFRPHLLDMMEPQSYPDRRLYPGGPPDPPYDMAGWTLPIQMGVHVIRVDDPVDISAEVIEEITHFSGDIAGSDRFGYLLPARSSMSSVLVNRMLADGHSIYRTAEIFEHGENIFEAGTFIIENQDGTGETVRRKSREIGLNLSGLDEMPDVNRYRISQPRIAMYQSWTSHIDEGWTRWIFDNYGFEYTTLHDADIRNGDLYGYDIIILPAIASRRMMRGNEPGTIPDEYVGGLGVEGALNLKKYVESGGMILGWDGATDFLIDNFGLPVENRLRNVDRQDFFIPGSLVAMNTDNKHPFAYGVQPETAAFFVTRRGSQSRSFSIIEPAEVEDRRAPEPMVEVFSRFADDNILLSGWALGEKQYLGGKPSAVRVGLGEGQVIMLGFRPQFRAQPRGTFNFIFNAIYASSCEGMPEVKPAYKEQETAVE